MEATERPWFADENGKIWRRHPSMLYENGGDVAGDYPLAKVMDGPSIWENKFPRDANAALIVRAVNQHEALMRCAEALRELRLQALQSSVNDPANEWGQEALAHATLALSALESSQ